MVNVIGIFEAPTYQEGQPLRVFGRIIFELPNTEAAGYFDLIAPLFEDFAQRDAHIGLHSINVQIVLAGSDLQHSIQCIDGMIRESRLLDVKWSSYLGSVQDPGGPLRDVYSDLRRDRLIAILRRLRAIFSEARAKRYCVVFGNGVAGRGLLGERRPPGTKIYC